MIESAISKLRQLQCWLEDWAIIRKKDRAGEAVCLVIIAYVIGYTIGKGGL